MTLVVGVDYDDEILVFADTRVSFRGNPTVRPLVDRLIKLVTVRFGERTAVLGFSGNVDKAKAVVESLRRKAKYYSSSGDLPLDFKVWMEEAVRMRQDRHRLKFMLCDLDPDRDGRLHEYTINENGHVELTQPEPVEMLSIDSDGKLRHGSRSVLSIIGSGKSQKKQIAEACLQSVRSSKGFKSYEAFSDVRAGMAEGIISTVFRDIGSSTVGGPFTIFRIRPNEIVGPQYTWPALDVPQKIQVREENLKTIIHNLGTNETYDLYTIFDYSSADYHGHHDASASFDIPT